MLRPIHLVAAAAIALVVAAVGCPTAFSPSTGLTSPTSTPSPAAPSSPAPITMNAVAGRWTLDATAPESAADGACSQFDYSVTPAGDGGSAVVRLTAVCPAFQLSGGGAAVLSGSRLAWNSTGPAQRGPVQCAFEFTRSTATPAGDGMTVAFSGTVCGLPASGSARLRRAN